MRGREVGEGAREGPQQRTRTETDCRAGMTRNDNGCEPQNSEVSARLLGRSVRPRQAPVAAQVEAQPPAAAGDGRRRFEAGGARTLPVGRRGAGAGQGAAAGGRASSVGVGEGEKRLGEKRLGEKRLGGRGGGVGAGRAG